MTLENLAPGPEVIKRPGYVHPTETAAVQHLKASKELLSVRERVGPCRMCQQPMVYEQRTCEHATMVQGICDNCGESYRRAGPVGEGL